jgi:hypothetical protein
MLPRSLSKVSAQSIVDIATQRLKANMIDAQNKSSSAMLVVPLFGG